MTTTERPKFLGTTAFPMLTLKTPTGDPRYHILTVDIIRDAPDKGYVAFTASQYRICLPLHKRGGYFFTEYDGTRYPIFGVVGGAITVFYESVLDIFYKMTREGETQ